VSDGANGKKYLGKYRGMVTQNVDPERRGRLQVSVSDVSIIPGTWAMPCVPIAGPQMGMFVIPPVNAGVWVEFEQGDSNYPIWVGCWWGTTLEVPATAALTPPLIPVVVVQTPATQTALVMCDVPVPPMVTGGIMLKSGASYITVDPTGVTITAPKININGLTIVNAGALTVT
jgi:hypothetical protein